MITQKEFCNLCRTHFTCGRCTSRDYQGHIDIWNAHAKICSKEFANTIPGDVEPHIPELCGECLQDRCACGSSRHCKTTIKNCSNCNCILCIEEWKKNTIQEIQKMSNRDLFDNVSGRNCRCTSGGGVWEELDQWADRQREIFLRDRLREFLHE